MEDNLVEAMIMAFSAIVFVIAFTLTMYMFTNVTYTSEVLTANADTTRFYENVEMKDLKGVDETLKKEVLEGEVKIIDSSSIIPTLYRYYKENFCVKIYDATNNASTIQLSKDGNDVDVSPRLIQVFDMTIEGKVNEAIMDSNAKTDAAIALATTPDEKLSRIRHNALINTYDQAPESFNRKSISIQPTGKIQSGWYNYSKENRIYMFGAPWVGSTENTKRRIDYFISGSDGYINNQYVNYVSNPFSVALHANDANRYTIICFY